MKEAGEDGGGFIQLGKVKPFFVGV
ncbi:uncharacterized protein METZ01_LOCUS333115, partial [marine metagenome]